MKRDHPKREKEKEKEKEREKRGRSHLEAANAVPFLRLKSSNLDLA